MTIPKISNVPVAPSRSRPSNFRVEGDTFFAHIEQEFEPELNASIDSINATAEEMDINAVASLIAAQNAGASATTAAATAAASAWVSGQTYTINTATISQVNFQTYRKRTNSAGSATDPANDSTNWRIIASGTNTFIPVPVAGTSIDLRLGPYFTKTINSNTTLSIDNCPPEGVCFTLELNMVSGSVAFAQAAAIKTPYDAPMVLTVGKTHELMFVTSNGGTRWRVVPANSFTT